MIDVATISILFHLITSTLFWLSLCSLSVRFPPPVVEFFFIEVPEEAALIQRKEINRVSG